MEQGTYYQTYLKQHLSVKQKENPSYSLRAFARDLNIHNSTLSQVLRSKRDLPLDKLKDVAEKLMLSPKEKEYFIDSYFKSKTKIDDIKIKKEDDRYLLDESYFKIIAEWEHFAVLELFELDNFNVSIETISKKLDIKIIRADVVLNNLVTCGLIKRTDDGFYKKTHENYKTTEDITSPALKLSHLETLKMGSQKLDEVALEFRDFSSMTIALDPKKIKETKQVIREFRKKLTSLLSEGNKKEIYQLGIQFYPLSKIDT